MRGAVERSRLVTVVGPGGVGKTRLAVDFGQQQMRVRSDGVYWVDLTAAIGAADVAAETARALDVQTPAGDAAGDALARYLADRDALLVLDNCEHVLDACTALANVFLRSCQKVRLVATSREPLGIAGEMVCRLEPLLAPDARRLFVERARQRRPDLITDDDIDASIASICARLDHLPLAIELAAARISLLSPAEIDASLQAELSELRATRRDGPERHRSVRSTIAWSYNLLDSGEQSGLRGLAVFVGGFDAAAARAVVPGMTLDVLARLVDKSLVTVDSSDGVRTRYRLLESVRQYSADQMISDEAEQLRARHLAHFSTAGVAPEEGWPSAHGDQVVDAWSADYPNVRAAIEWAAETDAIAATRLLVATRDLFIVFGQADGRRLAELLRTRSPGPTADRATLAMAAGVFAFLLGDTAAADGPLHDARMLSAEAGARALEGWAVQFLGLIRMLGGDPARARDALSTARAIHHEVGDAPGEARCTAALGLTSMMDGERDRARELIETARTLAEGAGDHWAQGQTNLYLGLLTETSANPDAASSHFREAVRCLRRSRDTILLPVALIGQARLMTRREPRTALAVVAAAWAIRARVGGEFPPYYRDYAHEAREVATKAVGAEAAACWTDGSRLTVDDAITAAFGTPRPAAARPNAPAGLSTRELEVVRLVAEGLANKAIASRLHLSVRTVETHVGHILTKTGLDNRAQLATWVAKRNL